MKIPLIYILLGGLPFFVVLVSSSMQMGRRRGAIANVIGRRGVVPPLFLVDFFFICLYMTE